MFWFIISSHVSSPLQRKLSTVPDPSKDVPVGPSDPRTLVGRAPADPAPSPLSLAHSVCPTLAASASGPARLAVSGWPRPAGSSWVAGGAPVGFAFVGNFALWKTKPCMFNIVIVCVAHMTGSITQENK